jgi:hypothetical protein
MIPIRSMHYNVLSASTTVICAATTPHTYTVKPTCLVQHSHYTNMLKPCWAFIFSPRNQLSHHASHSRLDDHSYRTSPDILSHLHQPTVSRREWCQVEWSGSVMHYKMSRTIWRRLGMFEALFNDSLTSWLGHDDGHRWCKRPLVIFSWIWQWSW